MIGDRIRKRREELGLTQSDLEKLTGIGFRMISNYEKNRSKPNADAINLIMKALKCDANYLFPDTVIHSSDTTIPIRVEKPALTNRQEKIVELFKELSEEQQIKIIGIAEMYAVENKASGSEGGNTIKVYRAAQSDNNQEDEITEMSADRLQKLKDAPKSNKNL